VAPDFIDSLVGVHPFCTASATSPSNIAIFTTEGMLGIELSTEIQALLDLIQEIAAQHNLIKLNVKWSLF
jgi:hypothetical protein